jgi:hypothetical protein
MLSLMLVNTVKQLTGSERSVDQIGDMQAPLNLVDLRSQEM